MKRFPPKSFVKEKINNLKRYGARIYQIEGKTICCDIWEYFGHWKFGKKYYANPTVDFKDIDGSITASLPKIRVGDFIGIWTWNEIKNGKKIERVHVGEF